MKSRVRLLHELSIAEGILGIVKDYAEQNNASKVASVGLLIGEMAGVEIDSLEFCWKSLIRGTLADGAELVIERVPLVGTCDSCGRERHIEHYNFICPDCGGTMIVKSGRELRVNYIDME